MAGLKLTNLEEGLRPCEGAARHRPSHREGRIHRLRRSFRLRQVHASAMIAGLEQITGGTLEIDGMVVNDVPPSQARHRHGVPVLRALSAHDGLRQHGLRPALAKFSKDEIDAACERRQHPAADALSRPPAQGALGRPAPARRHRPRPSAAIPRSSCSTSRCPTSMPRCASPPASRSPSSTNRCPTRP
jgi:predicted acylesterase/phospholipase RssA